MQLEPAVAALLVGTGEVAWAFAVETHLVEAAHVRRYGIGEVAGLNLVSAVQFYDALFGRGVGKPCRAATQAPICQEKSIEEREE